MVNFVTLLASAALLSSRALAAPIPDSSINEPGVRAPNGTPITQTTEPTDTPNANYNNNYYSTSTAMMMDTTTTMMNDQTTTTMMDDTTTSTMMNDQTTTTMMADTTTSTMMADSTSTMMMDTTTTATATYTTPTYGSGYTTWNSGYDSCVQQCMQTYGAPPAMYTAPPTTTTTDSGSGGGSGNTLTVIVAPAQGILRFVPFALNASVGDTVHYVWNGSPHTVTRSSTVLPCNKTEDPTGFFASGVQNKSFTFDITVNDTNTIAYYCGVPGHCPKGMFAFINPPNANPVTTTTSLAAMMPALISNSSDLAMQAMYVANMTMNTSAYTWGDNIDMSDVPSELHEQFVQNVFQTRLMYAANPGMLEAGNGAVSPSGGAITVPADITQVSASAGGGSTTTSTTPPAGVAETASSTSATASSTGSPSGSAKTGGAMSKHVASSAALGVAVLVAFLAL